MEDMTTSEGSEVEEDIPLKIVMDMLNGMGARIENNLTQVHSQMRELRCEFNQQTDCVKKIYKRN